MKPFPSFRLLFSSTMCAALVACASTEEPPAPTVVRTRAPQGYDKTINNYFAFKIRDPPRTAQINVGQPEPGSCGLDGYVSSMRGWVVPAVYETRTGEVGKETIKVTAKSYYFWFLGDTIAGVTPRIELCPGVGSAFEEGAQPGAVAAGPPAAAMPEPPKDEGQKGSTAQSKKKTGKTSGGARKKSSAPPATTSPP